MSDCPAISSPRRYDLDWIRVIAFALLILYHVGMFYVPWDWHVNSPRPVAWLEPVMYLTNPWRLTLLFLVSGAATRFLFESVVRSGQGVGRLATSRIARLLPPLLFAMFVVVPPQSYFEVFEAARGLGIAEPARSTWLQDFWIKYATGRGGWCDSDGCLLTPTWNHMWFVAYLLIYSVALSMMLGAARSHLPLIETRLEAALRGWGVLVWPIAWLVVIRLALVPSFPITHALVDDWYNHVLSFSAFGFGFVIARSQKLKATFARYRVAALVLAVMSWAAWSAYAWLNREGELVTSDLQIAMRVVFAVDQWAWIVTILGYGARYLNSGGRVLRYLSGGVFCFYLVHQTLIVVLAHTLSNERLPLGVETILLIALTFAGSVITYELARRLGPIAALFGVSRRSRVQPGLARS